MCGRFSLAPDPNSLPELANTFGLAEMPNIPPRYNIAPSQAIAAIIQPKDSLRHLQWLQWGLIPSWVKEPAIGKLINARQETVDTLHSFKNAFRRRRCLILANGWYEWQQTPGEKRKQPFFLALEGNPVFAIAGLWEHWQGGDGSELLTCTIITTNATESVAPIHDRMPVILGKKDYEQWLDPNCQNPELIKALLNNDKVPQIKCHPVSTLVNRPANDSPDCVAPISL